MTITHEGWHVAVIKARKTVSKFNKKLSLALSEHFSADIEINLTPYEYNKLLYDATHAGNRAVQIGFSDGGFDYIETIKLEQTWIY